MTSERFYQFTSNVDLIMRSKSVWLRRSFILLLHFTYTYTTVEKFQDLASSFPNLNLK